MANPSKTWEASGRRATCIWVLTLLIAGLGARPAAAQPFAYVANFGGASVSMIDTVTQSTQNQPGILQIGNGPTDVAITPDGAFAYVTIAGEDRVKVINTATIPTGDPVVTAVVPVGSFPYRIEITPDGAFAYVVNGGSNNVTVINVASNTVVATVPVGDDPQMVAITPNGAFAYVANAGQNHTSPNVNSVSVIDTASNTVVATIPVGLVPDGVAITPNGAFAYVANSSSNSVSVINTASNTVVATIPVAVGPAEIAITPNGAFAYVTHYGSNVASNTVSVIATANNTVVATVTVGSRPYGVAITPNGAFAYVNNASSNSVSIIDTASNTVVKVVSVAGSPNGIAMSPATDTTAPTLSLPGNLTTEATSTAGAVVNFSASATDAVDGPVPVNCSPASGSTFPLGSTTVACSATDSHNNTANGSFSVTVQDTTAPSLSLPGTLTTEATGPNGATVTYSATANDLVDGSVAVHCSPASGSTFPLGSTAVQCSATDAHDNTANGSFSVTIQDTTAPSLSLPSPIAAVATSTAGATVSYTASATDSVDGPVAVTCTPPSGSTFPPGTTSVSCSASDAAGNPTMGTFPVTVTYSWSGVLQPINADGSSIFKLGRTVPVKFQLTGASASVTNATTFRLYVAQVSNAVVGTEMEAESTTPASTGNLFRYDASGNLYIYNWGTKGYTTGTYQLRVDLGDGVLNRTVIISLKP